MVVGKFGGTNLPPGFRFHPTDEELIMYYLKNQATSSPCPAPIIPEVDIYKFDPWELPDKAVLGENEWYFFSPRDRKYPNGVRPNRAAVSGYWKATGTDKSIYSGRKYVGIKKALVFYKGKPPKGTKTDWIMHEYRLSASRPQPLKQNGSMRLDDWVLCRIYKKKNVGRTLDQRIEDSNTQIFTPNEASDIAPKLEFPRTNSISHLWELDCLGSLSQLLNESSQNSSFGNYTNMMGNSENAPREINKITLGELPKQYMDSLKLQANHSSIANQHGFVDQLFQFQK